MEAMPGYMASQQIQRPKKGKELGFWCVVMPAPLPLLPADRGLRGSAARLLSAGDTARRGLEPL